MRDEIRDAPSGRVLIVHSTLKKKDPAKDPFLTDKIKVAYTGVNVGTGGPSPSVGLNTSFTF
jgi:hypothetical protein